MSRSVSRNTWNRSVVAVVPPPVSIVPSTCTRMKREDALASIPVRTMSTFGFVAPDERPWIAIRAGSQSEASPSIEIPEEPESDSGPRMGRRSRAMVTIGMTYTFHFAIPVSPASRSAPRPFVRPVPFVRPFVIPERMF